MVIGYWFVPEFLLPTLFDDDIVFSGMMPLFKLAHKSEYYFVLMITQEWYLD